MYENNVEYLLPDRWKQWHTELLQSTVNRVYNRVPFYRKRMDELGIRPEDIHSVEDLKKLPLTSRKDLSNNYPYDLFAVPLRDIVRIHTLRGSQATPVVLGYTKQDLEHRVKLTKRFLQTCGITPDDIVQICLDSGMAVWGQEIKDGAEALGALVIPPDPLNSRAQLQVLADFKTSVLVTTPSYGRHLLHELERLNIPLASLSLKTGIFIGEYLDKETRMEFHEKFSISIYSGYGILEAAGPGMAYECDAHSGLHLGLDHFIPEIIDPETGEVLDHGSTGELVITTVKARANPLLRFRTGDITKILPQTCECGRTTWRIEPVKKRCDKLISVRGIKIDPAQIASFIAEHSQGRKLDHLVVLRSWKYLKRIELWIALSEDTFSGGLPDLHEWIRRLETAFEETMGLPCRVRPVEKRTIDPYLASGKQVVKGDEI